ncbi:MAG: glucose-6-phosphate dehydrogenase assembly protein OpcA [Actinomycetota bacterium]|nr:glucose-6-phosphate dehydrogenase assembly protein OpcA [Actinomycetota bacterium]
MAGDLTAPAAEAQTDMVWQAQDTTPTAIEAALRALLTEARARSASYVPARSLNLVCIVSREYSGEVANRLRGVGRFSASRTVVCSVSPMRATLDATATIVVPTEPRAGMHAPMRETVVVEIGPQHLRHLETIVDPLVVTDVPTVVWSPHEHPDALDALLSLAQVVLVDSGDEPEPADAVARIRGLMERSYVVDLAWLRTTPWRERIAATFDTQKLRPDLRLISNVVVRHHPDSAIAGLLFVGWLASRLDWRLSRLSQDRAGTRTGRAHTRRQDVALRLQADRTMSVRGVAGMEIETANGRWLRLDRGAGGLRARYRGPRQNDREWTITGASRGESGILGEGIRQALLRDNTYRPALLKAGELLS